MLKQVEINHKYRKFVDNHNRWAKDLRDSGTSLESIGEVTTQETGRARRFLTGCRRSAVFVGQVALALLILMWVKTALLFRRRRRPDLYQAADEYVGEFVEQYPFHLYPILAKSMELAFLRDLLGKSTKPGEPVLELAIGEGTLSSRVFAKTDQVIGVDLSPYSLVKSTNMPHVSKAIVGDCLDPPILPGSFELLVSNNFLHHITEKDDVVARWSKLARRMFFNENTTYWASGWTAPFLFKKLGFRSKSRDRATSIEEYHAQSLRSREELDSIVSKHCQVDDCVSYLSERTFFLCSLFSSLMRCYGPPTPTECKEFAFGGRLRSGMTRSLTSAVARALLAYDVYQDRSRDVFVSYCCTSKNYSPSGKTQPLACPNCRVELTEENYCPPCGKEFRTTDGMLFLLDAKLDRWEHEYDSEFAAAIVKKAHL